MSEQTEAIIIIVVLVIILLSPIIALIWSMRK